MGLAKRWRANGPDDGSGGMARNWTPAHAHVWRASGPSSKRQPAWFYITCFVTSCSDDITVTRTTVTTSLPYFSYSIYYELIFRYKSQHKHTTTTTSTSFRRRRRRGRSCCYNVDVVTCTSLQWRNDDDSAGWSDRRLHNADGPYDGPLSLTRRPARRPVIF